MYRELLKDAEHWLKTYGRSMQPPCSDEAVEELRQRAQSVLGAAIPGEYAVFLRIANGFDWNGCVVYASETTPIVGYTGGFSQTRTP